MQRTAPEALRPSPSVSARMRPVAAGMRAPGEQRNKAVMLEMLFIVFQIIANSLLPQAPPLARIFNQVVEMAGVLLVFLGKGGGAGVPD